ncbi:hypothetical protein [Erythrobacter sp. JK5]|uniref:hypothetical protein n=1 Tax=Erythrobacter sp. JK5 TaxID=2829500 RepID=UPI001BAC3283|nr:hypothetical protein [Erythrobacter sp. JK5]QUL37227.1 hypothetical protein KDC96_12700 [Erythrobacter sp. JK5]
MRSLVAVAVLFAVSACAGGSARVPTRPSAAPAPVAAAPPAGAFKAPQVLRGRGLDGIIGARATTLTARFGSARIDLTEGDARKLQFASDRCVLDVFLYPLEAGAEPVATHVETRWRAGGAEADRADCIAEIDRG